MSIVRTAVAKIAERGRATVDDILPEMPGRTRAQVVRALQQAKHRGLLTREERRRARGEGVGRGTALPCVYRRNYAPVQTVAAPSVWAYAQRTVAAPLATPGSNEMNPQGTP